MSANGLVASIVLMLLPNALPPPAVHIVARDFAFDMPAAIEGGVVTFSFENRGREPHYMRFLRLADGKTAEDVLAWRRTRTPPPSWLSPAGGIGTVAPGLSAQYAARLEPGRYVAFCGHPSPDGTPHVEKGMIRELTVGASVTSEAPRHSRTVELAEHVLTFEPPTARARETWRVINRGTSTHQALLVRLPTGVSADMELAWFREGSRGPRPGQPVGGVIELAPGGEAWFTATLEPGSYVLLCGVAASATDRHFDRGMVRRFTVE